MSQTKKERQLSLRDLFEAGGTKEKRQKVQEQPGQDGDNNETVATTSSSSATDFAVEQPQVEQQGQVPHLDIGLFIGKNDLSDDVKYQLLKNRWRPDNTYNFPKIQQNKQSRSFSLKWLVTYEWLAYSHEKGGAFCAECVLFAKPTVGKGLHQSTGVLVSTPLCRYKDALEEFRRHCHDESYHSKEVHIDAMNFIMCYDDPGKNIINRCERGRERQVQENRARIRPIIKTVLFCGRQGLALRGTDDNGDLKVNEPDHNDGNFRALLRFRMDAGDSDLVNHVANAPHNATYISAVIQNEIIACCATIIEQRIAREVHEAKHFSVLADETCDLSKKDQFAIVVRFVKDNYLYERFLTFVEVTNRTGAGLAKTIIDTLTNCGIDVMHMRGQGYDSCNTMSGRFAGVQAQVKKTCPLAHYLPCSSHVFNLAVVHSCDIPQIANAIGTMKTVCSSLSGSSDRVRMLSDNVTRMLPESTHKRVKPYCNTRFIENHAGVVIFMELLMPIVATLEETKTGKSDSATRANELLSAVCKCEFLVALAIIESCATLLLPLSIQLQSTYLDLCEAVSMVKDIIDILSVRRQNADEEFHDMFMKVSELCEKLDVPVRGPRVVARQQHRDNPPYTTPEEYFKRTVFIPYLDMLNSELSALFLQHQNECLKLQFLVPKFLKNASFDDIINAVQFYGVDITASVSAVKSEFERWQKKWSTTPIDDCPKNAIESLQSCSPTSYPNVNILLKIFATLPVTSCSCERSFSSLRVLKSYLRSTMSEDRLNGLAHLFINRQFSMNPDEVLDMFARKPRRFDFNI